MRFIVFDQLKDRGIPWTREHVARRVKANQFPKPVSLSPKRIAWVEDEIVAWQEALVAARDTKDAA